MTDLIRIEFTDNKEVYSPSDKVTGSVIISCQCDCYANSKCHVLYSI